MGSVTREFASRQARPGGSRRILTNWYLDKSGSLSEVAPFQDAGLSYLSQRFAADPILADIVFMAVTVMSGLVVSARHRSVTQFDMPFLPAGGGSPHLEMLSKGVAAAEAFRSEFPDGLILDFVVCDGKTPEMRTAIDRAVTDYRAKQGPNWHTFVVATDPDLNFTLLSSLSVEHEMIVLQNNDWAQLFDVVASFVTMVAEAPEVVGKTRSLDLDEIRRRLDEHETTLRSGL